MDLKNYIKEKQGAVDLFFKDYFAFSCHPAVLKEAMLYSLFAGGKRIRPVLAIASYEACGGRSDDIIPYAATLELIHTYSLIHDDLPAMDDDDLRRGKPTNHIVYGEAIAILAGDALLTEAFGILANADLSPAINSHNLLKVLRDVADAAGLNGMVAGQVQDILSEDSVPDQDTLHFIHTRKTGALMRASVRMGPLLAGSTPHVLDTLTRYGENLGLAFQIIDDILDVEGDTEELGKPVGSDEKINKMTYPRLYGIKKSRETAETLIHEAVEALNGFSAEAEPLREIAGYLLTRRN